MMDSLKPHLFQNNDLFVWTTAQKHDRFHNNTAGFTQITSWVFGYRLYCVNGFDPRRQPEPLCECYLSPQEITGQPPNVIGVRVNLIAMTYIINYVEQLIHLLVLH